MVVERMEQADLERAGALALALQRDDALFAALPVFQGRRPTRSVGQDTHPVRPQEMQFLRAAGRHQFQIGIAREEEIAIERLQERRSGLALVRPVEQRKQRVLREFRLAFVKQPGNRGRSLGQEPHAAMDDGIAQESLPGQSSEIAPRPMRLAVDMQRDEAGRALLLGGHGLASRTLRPGPVKWHRCLLGRKRQSAAGNRQLERAYRLPTAATGNPSPSAPLPGRA